MTTPNIELPEIPEAIQEASGPLNQGFRRLDAIVQLSVLDKDLTVPPASAVQGSRYIVPTDAGGVWSGRGRHIAIRLATGWMFVVPRPGWLAFVEDEQRLYRYRGATSSWEPFPSAAEVPYSRESPSLLTASNVQDAIDEIVQGPWLLPPGGTTGQALVKQSNDDFDADWAEVSGGGGSGGVSPPDEPPTVANDANDEFDAGVSIDTAGTRFSGATPWAWRNQGGATATIAQDALLLTAPAASGANLRIVEQPAPSAPWRYRAKIAVPGAGANNGGGVVLVNSGNGRAISWQYQYGGAAVSVLLGVNWTSVTAFASTFFNTNMSPVLGPPAGWQYYEVENDGTNLIFRMSPTGYQGTYRQIASTTIAGFLGAVTHIGLLANADSSTLNGLMLCDWFRRVA